VDEASKSGMQEKSQYGLVRKKGINGVNGKEGEHVKPPIVDDELT